MNVREEEKRVRRGEMGEVKRRRENEWVLGRKKKNCSLKRREC